MRARAARAHLQEPDLVHRRDAAAARADLDQLDGGDADGQPAALDEAPLPRGLEAVGGERLAAVHHRELGGGPAHVEGQHLAIAVGLAEEGGRDGAGGGARLQHLHRHPLGLLHVGEPAAREHQQERRGDAQLRHAPGHQREVLLRERLDVGVGRGGGGALVLADLRRHLVRGRHRDAGMALRDQPRRLLLVAWVGVGMQKHHRDRLDPGLRQRVGSRGQHARVQAPRDPAVGPRALGHLEAQVARHERLGLGDGQVVELVLPLAPDLERVREAFGGDEAGHRALALDQRVGEQGGGVDGPGERGGIEPGLSEQPRRARGHRARRIVVGGEDLAAPPPAGVVVVRHQVGEGPADVDPERVLGHRIGSATGPSA